MPAKKSKTPLNKNKKSFIDPTIIVTIACIVIGGLIFVHYASAATIDTIAK